ncbi:MAG: hypothetical protein QOE79_1004 [Sphingomonadales bacterium]|jgi:hypothetical protein|nr:hypothetical protein [Sphingomonadales bacterium]
MADAQPEAAAGSLRAASQLLRETAKWLVGGVTATAAGVFAGSSLTNLGSLSLPADVLRLLAALLGVLFGLACIGQLAWRAIDVLVVETISLDELVDSPDSDRAKLVTRLEAVFKDALPGQTTTLADLRDKIRNENKKEAAQQDTGFLDSAGAFLPMLMAEASFRHVADRFDRLRRILRLRVAGAVIGFGVFAWAANPPARPAPAPEPPAAIPY